MDKSSISKSAGATKSENQQDKQQAAPAYKLKYQFNPNYKGRKGFKNTLPSMTVPDLSLSVRELLINHTRGINSGVTSGEPLYFEDEMIPNIQDITELAELKETLKAREELIKNSIEKNKRLAEELAQEKLKNSADEKEDEKSTTPS